MLSMLEDSIKIMGEEDVEPSLPPLETTAGQKA